MVDQVDVHGVVFKQIVNHVEVINCADRGLVRLSILEHVMRANHKPSVIG